MSSLSEIGWGRLNVVPPRLPILPVLSRAVGASIAPAQFDERFERADRNRLPATFADGWNAGYEAGLSEGETRTRATLTAEQEAAERRVRLMSGAVRDAADRLSEAMRSDTEDMAAAMLDAAYTLAELIVGRELADRPRNVREALAAALALMPERAPGIARLNPADLGDLEHPLDDLAVTGAYQQIEIVADPSIAPGDCVIDLPDGKIELRLSDAIARAGAIVLSECSTGTRATGMQETAP